MDLRKIKSSSEFQREFTGLYVVRQNSHHRGNGDKVHFERVWRGLGDLVVGDSGKGGTGQQHFKLG